MSTISETVAESLRNAGYGSYLQYADEVIEALENRERDIVNQILMQAAELEVDEDQARQALEEAGLTMPEPEPEQAASNSDGDLVSTLQRINQRLESLEQVARSRGLI